MAQQRPEERLERAGGLVCLAGQQAGREQRVPGLREGGAGGPPAGGPIAATP